MPHNLKNLELTDADLLGHAPAELECAQCGGAFCGFRVGRVLNGRPLIMCPKKEATKEVLSALGKRSAAE